MCFFTDDKFLDAKIDLQYASPVRGMGRNYETSEERSIRLAQEQDRRMKARRIAAEVEAINKHGFELKDAYIHKYLNWISNRCNLFASDPPV